MLRPLPFSEPDRLMLVHMLMPERDAPGVFRQTIWSYPKYRRLRDEQHSFQSTALFVGREYNLTGSRSPARVPLELVEHTYFNLLGVTPQVGRTFTADETKAPGSEPMVVLGYGFWVSRFGGGCVHRRPHDRTERRAAHDPRRDAARFQRAVGESAGVDPDHDDSRQRSRRALQPFVPGRGAPRRPTCPFPKRRRRSGCSASGSTSTTPTA